MFEPPVQLHPAITAVQVGLHPRPSKIFAAPLSHTSVPTFSPSPQIGVQTFGTPFVQEYPVSIAVQSLLQPSLLIIFPSSHASVYSPTVYLFEFPHLAQLFLVASQYP
jgi:hypothetical protein